MKAIIGILLLAILTMAHAKIECDTISLEYRLNSRGDKVREEALAIFNYVWSRYDGESDKTIFIEQIKTFKMSSVVSIVIYMAQQHPEICDESMYNKIVGIRSSSARNNNLSDLLEVLDSLI